MKEHDVFIEFNKHLMMDSKPSTYFNERLNSGIFYNSYPLTLLGNLTKTEQEPKHHPEGNVWNHTMMVLDECAQRKTKSQNPGVLMWAGLLHDIGKPSTTKIRKDKITAYDHDKIGEKLCTDFLKEYTIDTCFINEVSKLVRWHMQTLFVVKNLPFAEIKNMLKEVSLDEVALLSLCDRLGRGNMDSVKIKKEEKNIEIFLEKCRENEYVR